jgi:hypothetical protein
MPLTTLPLFGRGFSSKSAVVTTQKLTNAYRDAVLDQDKTALPIYGTPGLSLEHDVGAPIRGAISINDFIYGVAGANFFLVAPSGIVVTIGVITTFSGAVYFAWNGTQLLFVDGQTGWIYVPSTAVLTQIADLDFPQPGPNGPLTCTWMAGYFFVSVNGTGRFQWSAVNDGLVWDPLDFATAETAPDNLLRIEQDNGELVLLGDKTTEFWGMSGDANVVRRIGGSGVEWGCVSPTTVAKFTTGLAWLAQNRMGEAQVVVLNGYQVAPVSGGDPEINHELNNRSRENLAAATAFSYFMDGHAFYQINFPDASYLYDGMTDSWSQLTSSGTFGARHYANGRVALEQQPIVFDYRNGRIYLLDKTVYTDNGDVIMMEVAQKHIFNSGNYVTVDELAVEIEAGDGLDGIAQGTDPQIMASWSKDGGRTWGNEVWRTAGKIGAYRQRAAWRGLGVAKDFAFKLRISDPVKRVILSADVQVS